MHKSHGICKDALKSKSCLSDPSYAEVAIFEPAPDFLECSASQPYFIEVWACNRHGTPVMPITTSHSSVRKSNFVDAAVHTWSVRGVSAAEIKVVGIVASDFGRKEGRETLLFGESPNKSKFSSLPSFAGSVCRHDCCRTKAKTSYLDCVKSNLK